MDYLTHFYRNKTQKLQERVNLLENFLKESAINANADSREGTATIPGGPSYPPGGFPAQFNGAYLGQLLGQGNMQAVNQYLQNWSNIPGGQPPMQLLRKTNTVSNSAPQTTEEEPPTGGPFYPPFNGAYLGQLLGAGDMNAVREYLSRYGINL